MIHRRLLLMLLLALAPSVGWAQRAAVQEWTVPGPAKAPAPWGTQQVPRSGPQCVRSAQGNFTCCAPTAQIAQQCADCAEQARRDKALQWLGRELPPWSYPCPIKVTITMGGAGGATSFAFDNGRVLGQTMHVEGPLDRLLASVIPHEVTHTIFAAYHGRPSPRWADEGGAVLEEDERSRNEHATLCRQILNTPGRMMPLRRLFSYWQYPQDVMVLYAQGYSVTSFLVAKADRPTFLKFVGAAIKGGWDGPLRTHYGYQSVEALEKDWIEYCWGRLQPRPVRPLPATTPQPTPTPAEPVQPPPPDTRLQDLADKVKRALEVGDRLRDELERLKGIPPIPGPPGRDGVDGKDGVDGTHDTATVRKIDRIANTVDGLLPILYVALGLGGMGAAVPVIQGGVSLFRRLRPVARAAAPIVQQVPQIVERIIHVPQPAPAPTPAPAPAPTVPTPPPVAQQPTVIVRENPPPPQVVRTETQFVTVEGPSVELQALHEAMDEYVRKHPGAISAVETMRAYAAQIASGTKKGR